MNCEINYNILNNSFDGVQPLNVPDRTDLNVSSCPSCQQCEYNQGPCGNKFHYKYDPSLRFGLQNNDPLSCQRGDFSCSDNMVYARDIEPTLVEYPRKEIILNNSFGLSYTPGFFPVKSSCGGEAYTSPYDPRLRRQDGLTIPLDRPSLWGQVPLNKIYDKQYGGYGKNYTNYRDINTGQIQYYYDKSDANPYFQPLYTIQSNVTHRVFKDPMDSLKMYYDKVPVNLTLRNVSDYQTTRDTLSFREDIMSKQSSLMNRNNWTYRWASPTGELN